MLELFDIFRRRINIMKVKYIFRKVTFLYNMVCKAFIIRLQVIKKIGYIMVYE